MSSLEAEKRLTATRSQLSVIDHVVLAVNRLSTEVAYLVDAGLVKVKPFMDVIIKVQKVAEEVAAQEREADLRVEQAMAGLNMERFATAATAVEASFKVQLDQVFSNMDSRMAVDLALPKATERLTVADIARRRYHADSEIEKLEARIAELEAGIKAVDRKYSIRDMISEDVGDCEWMYRLQALEDAKAEEMRPLRTEIADVQRKLAALKALAASTLFEESATVQSTSAGASSERDASSSCQY